VPGTNGKLTTGSNQRLDVASMVLGGGDHRGRQRAGEVAEGGDHGEAERPAPMTATTPAPAGTLPAPLMAQAAGLDHDRGLVGHVVGDAVQLGLVGHEGGRPAAAGVGAVPGLQSRLEVPERDVAAPADLAAGTALARRLDAAGRAPEHRLQHDARAVVEVTDDLVPGTNGKLTTGSNQRLDVASIVARSEPQMPARRGRTRTQPGASTSGGSASTRRSGPGPAPRPGASEPARRAAAKRGSDRS
jgi:hypothetical protein